MTKKIIKTIDKQDFSQSYNSIHSIQKLNSIFDTNVFATNIPIAQLLKNRDILLVDDLKGDARWGMNKIIQRNISEKRVKEIKNEYLQAVNRSIKFFPAITVVLLPKSKGEPKQNFEYSKLGFDLIEGVDVEKGYHGDDFEYDMPVEIKWDKNQISALVIDGQHRVSAIREFYDGKNESSYNKTSIPATFVLFKNDTSIDLIQATRALFIDVNNTPRLVSEEKLIFIDDRNIHRRITARLLGANDPGNDAEDVYQKMLRDEDYLLNSDKFISRYLIEESGKDDEENRGFLSNHKTLFPWEISNILTIHRNILGNILLRYKSPDKTRDIRSICYQLNGVILEEINSAESLEEISNPKLRSLLDRLSHAHLSESEIDVFKNLIRIKTKNLEEIQQAEGEFFIGTIATPDEIDDRNQFIKLLQNIYNQDCSKDSTFELSGDRISDLLNGNAYGYVNIIAKVFNNIWFAQQIKESILSYNGEDRKLIFNFILNAHESLKVENNIRRRTDKVEKQINIFFDENEEKSSNRKNVLTEWSTKLQDSQVNNLLRTVVGQEMLFLFIIDQSDKLSAIDIERVLNLINSLGSVGFFDNSYKLDLNFFGENDFKISDFNQWSEIILKGESMKPGLTNAMKGANLISLVQKEISNRTNAGSNLNIVNRLQKSYGQVVEQEITKNDPKKLYKMYRTAKNAENLHFYLTHNEIETLNEDFLTAETITPKAKNVIIKLYGGLALEQVINHFKSKI